LAATASRRSKARPSSGKKLVAPFGFEADHSETIYLVPRTEQARDRRIGAVRRWIEDAVSRAKQ
jgi:LysR family glycine cleavage system transcriptional activator